MQPDESREYRIESTSNRSARVEDIEICRSQNGTTRKVLRAEIVENTRNSSNTVKATIVHQRQSRSVAWQDMDGIPLSQLHAGEVAKFSLSSEETKRVYDVLSDLYRIGAEGIRPGTQVLVVANEDAVVETQQGKARLLRKIAQSENLENYAEFEEEFGGDAPRSFAVTKLHAERSRILAEFEQRLTESHDENNWKRYLKEHSWIFGISNIEVLDETRLGIHHDTDIPFEVEGGFMDIVELKRPDQSVWVLNGDGTTRLYRSKFPVPHFETSAGIAQVSGYILEAEKHVNDADFIRDHGGKVPLKPRGLVVIGRSQNWGEVEWRAYRLMNDDLHGIQVITYDQLLERARKALAALTT